MNSFERADGDQTTREMNFWRIDRIQNECCMFLSKLYTPAIIAEDNELYYIVTTLS